mgnify:CR=1 FL=1
MRRAPLLLLLFVLRWSHGATYTAFPYGMTWFEAQQYCAGRGGSLAVIASSYDNTRAGWAIGNISSPEMTWLGGTDRQAEGMWTWERDGSSATSYANWSAGQPDDGHGSGEHCMAMDREHSWFDMPCRNRYAVLCQDLAALPSSDAPTWYQVFTESRSWASAAAHCARLGGSLAAIDSASACYRFAPCRAQSLASHETYAHLRPY